MSRADANTTASTLPHKERSFMNNFLCATILMVHLVILTNPCHAGSSIPPINGKIDEVFFSWVEKCFNRDTLDTSTGIESSPPDIKKYISFVRKHIKNANGIRIQNARLESGGFGLPYLYIDKKYNFVRYIPRFSDTNMYTAVFGSDTYTEFEEIDMVFQNFYFKILQTNKKQKILIVIKRSTDSGNDLSHIWFFTVDAAVKQNSVEYSFSLIQSEAETLLRYKNKIIEDYDMCDFYPKRRIDGTGCELDDLPLYDIDKKTGDLFVYFQEEGIFCLRFVWNGERYVKKGLVMQDFYNTIQNRRGQE